MLGITYLTWLAILAILAMHFKYVASLSLSTQGAPSFLDSVSVYERAVPLNAGLAESQLLFHDDDIVVYNKASYVQSAPGFTSPESLATLIAHDFKIDRVDQMIVHRLDYATSGLIVYARNPKALKLLHNQFRSKPPQKGCGNGKKYASKEYEAIISGVLSQQEGCIDMAIGRDIARPPLMRTSVLQDDEQDEIIANATSTSSQEEQGGELKLQQQKQWLVKRAKLKPSLTQYRVVDTKEQGHSLVSLTPVTGRTHQLRVHLAAIGHPILGDLFYADHEIYRESKRLLLHAKRLEFYHPRTNELVHFQVEAPFTLDNYEEVCF